MKKQCQHQWQVTIELGELEKRVRKYSNSIILLSHYFLEYKCFYLLI